MQYKRTVQHTLVGRAKESPSFTLHPGQMVDKGDSDAKMADGDLIDFKSDVTYIPKTETKVSTGKKSKAAKSFYDKSDFIDFLAEDDWPAGQSPFQIGDRTPQVKRKLEHPNQCILAKLLGNILLKSLISSVRRRY